MQLPTGGDAPFLIAFAAVYGLVEVIKIIAQRRNHAIPRLIEELQRSRLIMTTKVADLIRGQDKIGTMLKEQSKTAVATLERIERKVEGN